MESAVRLPEVPTYTVINLNSKNPIVNWLGRFVGLIEDAQPRPELRVAIIALVVADIFRSVSLSLSNSISTVSALVLAAADIFLVTAILTSLKPYIIERTRVEPIIPVATALLGAVAIKGEIKNISETSLAKMPEQLSYWQTQTDRVFKSMPDAIMKHDYLESYPFYVLKYKEYALYHFFGLFSVIAKAEEKFLVLSPKKTEHSAEVKYVDSQKLLISDENTFHQSALIELLQGKTWHIPQTNKMIQLF